MKGVEIGDRSNIITIFDPIVVFKFLSFCTCGWQPAELEKKYRLKFRTSSFELKAKAAAEEKKRVARIEKAKEAKKLRSDSSGKRALTDKSNPNQSIGESSDGSAVASSPLVQERKESEKQNGVAAGRSDVETVLGGEAAVLSSCDEEAMVSDGFASRSRRRGVQIIGSACAVGEKKDGESEAVGGSAAQAESEKSSKPEAVCPCEWFACDDEDSGTRHFVIQVTKPVNSRLPHLLKAS